MAEEDKKPNIPEICPMDYEPCDKKQEIIDEYSITKVFLDIPYSDYPKVNQTAIEDTIKKYDLTPVLAERSRRTKSLYCNVCKNIHKCDIAIVDITGQNPNVLIELGIIQRNQMKYCILCRKGAEIPLDLRGLTVEKYVNKGGIEKRVSKWIADNVDEIALRIAKQRKIFDVIFYQLENKDFRGILAPIAEILEIGERSLFINEFNRIIDIMIGFLKDEDSYVREGAAFLLGVIKPAKAVDPLIQILIEDEDKDVRLSAVKALIEIKPERDLEPFVQGLKDKYYVVRSFAAEALGGTRSKKAIEPLKKALKSERSKSVKTVIRKAIAKIESEGGQSSS